MSYDEDYLGDSFHDQLTPEEWEAYLGEYEMASSPLERTHRCVVGVFDSLWLQILVLTLCSVVQGCITRLLIPRGYERLHAISLTLLGIAALFYILPGSTTVSIVALYALLFVLLTASFGTWKHFSFVSCAYSLFFLLGCQQMLDEVVFVSFRGALMVQIMKSVSFAFDSPSEISYFSLLAYLMHPATIIFGPFVSYREFSKSSGFWNGGFKTFAKLLAAFVLSLLFLFASTCVAEELLHSWFASHWLLESYKTAMSFRYGHYYVCYLSYALCLLSGIATEEVTDWKAIELPRSMVDVVVFWNVPMKEFLHKCVFEHTRRYGRSTAVMATFLASSLLHGFNFQLTAVLLSLGFYSVTEQQFRLRLSRRMNACVKARSCSDKCSHTHNSFSLRTAVVNFAFSALTVYHLIYLGLVFDNSESEESGYSMSHTLGKWAEWKFCSHIIAFAMLLLGYTVL